MKNLYLTNGNIIYKIGKKCCFTEKSCFTKNIIYRIYLQANYQFTKFVTETETVDIRHYT